MKDDLEINLLPLLEGDGSLRRYYRRYLKRYKQKAPARRRRSFSLNHLDEDMDPNDLHEATPLLLLSRLNQLLTPPQDQYKRVGKVIGNID